MWPKLLDLTQDECRGMLRRLELESYSNVMNTFRAQGSLNEKKMKMLCDLRDAFHISDDRHRAEVRRVVNDESFSTIAKAVYGPNSEIEWNKEGARGFSILTRSTPQTALSVLADSAAELGDKLNAKLPQPANTQRSHTLSPIDDESEATPKIVTADPLKIESKRPITLPAKLKPPLIELNAMNNKPRKRGSNKLNSPNNASRIQQLYNSHNSKANTNLSQRKSVSGSTPSYPTVCSTKAGSVTNRRRKSELLSPNSRAADPSTAVHSTKIAAIADNERQLQEEEVNSVSLQSHKHKFSTTSNDTNVQISAIKPVPAQVRSKTPILPRTSAVSRPSQKQFVYQHHQPYLAPKMAKAMPAIVTAPNATLENSATQSNGTPQSTSQFVSHEVRNALQSTTAPNQRIPPKINILSQQTITKSNINFVPLADNKIIIKSDSKLANAFKSQKIQMIPGQISTVASSTMDGTKMHSQNNLIIRGTSERPMHQPKLFSVPLNSNHRNVQAFYVNMPTSQSPTSIHTIEKVITDETPVDFIANEIDDYIIDETTDTYESVEQSVENTAAYVTTTTHNKIEPIPAKKIKLLSNKEHRASISNASQHFRTHATNNEIVPTIIYEEQQVSTDWDYGVGYKHGGKPNCNGRAIATTDSEVVVEDDTTEYHDSNIIYTEEEVIDDDNVLQEEYVTTEIFPPNDNVIEMEIDSLIL